MRGAVAIDPASRVPDGVLPLEKVVELLRQRPIQFNADDPANQSATVVWPKEVAPALPCRGEWAQVALLDVPCSSSEAVLYADSWNWQPDDHRPAAWARGPSRLGVRRLVLEREALLLAARRAAADDGDDCDDHADDGDAGNDDGDDDGVDGDDDHDDDDDNDDDVRPFWLK